MTTCSAACSLATEERPSPGTGSPAPRPRPAPTAHYRTRHQLQALLHPPTGFGSVPVPSSPTHLPPPDKVNFPPSRSPACCVPPSEPLALSSPGALFRGPSCPAVPGFPVEGPGSIPWP